jgi:hypothetical protein
MRARHSGANRSGVAAHGLDGAGCVDCYGPINSPVLAHVLNRHDPTTLGVPFATQRCKLSNARQYRRMFKLATEPKYWRRCPNQP